MTVGERIKNRRKELGISADSLASLIGVSRSTMFRYEKGDIEKLPGDSLVPIAQALGTTPQYLMGWTEDTSFPIPTATASYNITPAEYSLVLAYRQASDADRQIIDNIVERYRPVKKFKTG